MTATPPDGGASDGVPQSGDLKIKERRSWRTWQLLTVALVAAILGMWINGDTGGGGSSSATSSNPDGGKLPAEGAGAPAASGSGGTTTTVAAGGTATTTRREQLGNHHHGSGRVDDHHRGRGVHHCDHGGGGSRRAGTRALTLAAAKGELDQHRVHHDGRSLEHWLGVQLRPRSGRRPFVPGVRDASRVVSVSVRYGRRQRDGRVRTVGDATIQPGRTGARGADDRVVFLDHQGDGLVAAALPGGTGHALH